MIKKSLMAAILFFYSINVISQTDITRCNFSAKNQAINLSNNFNLCDIDNFHRLNEEFTPAPSHAHNEASFPFHVKKNKGSLAQSVTVMLFIPGLIILLFSRHSKSAK